MQRKHSCLFQISPHHPPQGYPRIRDFFAITTNSNNYKIFHLWELKEFCYKCGQKQAKYFKLLVFFNWIWVWALEIKAKGCSQITTIAKVIHNPGLPLISPYHLTAHNCNCHNQTGHRSHQKFCCDYKAGLAQFPAFPSLMKPTWWGFTACASWGARKISSSFGGWLMLTMTCPKASDWFKASFTWEPLLSSLPSSSPSLPESLLSTIWRASSSPELSSITSVTKTGEKKGQSLTDSRVYCIWKKKL